MPIIEIPKCEWCKRISVDAYKCRSCRRLSCNDCHLGYDRSDRCQHHKYEPLVQDNWDIE